MSGLLTTAQFCERYNVGRTRLYRLISAGKIEARKDGRLTRITADSAEKWAQSLASFKPARHPNLRNAGGGGAR